MTTQETATELQTALDDVGPLVSALARGIANPDSLMGYQRGPDRPGLSDAENALRFVRRAGRHGRAGRASRRSARAAPSVLLPADLGAKSPPAPETAV